MLPGLNFSVLDSNEVDNDATLARLIAEYHATGTTVVIPWVFLYEQSKGREDWFYAVHERFRACPAAFVWAKSTIDLHQEERRTRRRVRSVEKRRQTLRFRHYLGYPGPLPRTVDFTALQTRMSALFRFWSPANSLETMMGAFEFPPEELRTIRRELQSNDRSTLQAAMAQLFLRYGRAFLESVGHRKVEARRLALYPSFSALTFLATTYQGMRWHVRPPSREHLADQAWLDREAADMEALLLSLYGRELVTRDQRLLEVREDLVAIVKAVW